jgi:hypothetical protein
MPDPSEAGPTRTEELRALARDYLADAEMTIYGTILPKVAALAARLGSEESVNSFVSMVKVVHRDNPDGLNLLSWTDTRGFLGDLKKALIRKLRRAAREPGAMAAVTNIDEMLQSESPLFVCVGLLLRQRRGRLWFDTFLNQIRTDWKCDRSEDVVEAYDVDDAVMRKIMMWMMALNIEVLGNVHMRTVEQAVFYVAELDCRDVLVDHVKGVPQWDRVERLKDMMTIGFGAVVDDEQGQTLEYLEAVGRNMVVSMTARALRAGCKMDTMPVFLGAQGTLKSTAMQILGGPFFAEISENPANKDFYLQIQGVWLGEIAELASIVSTRVDMAKVKQALSCASDKFRVPYGRTSKHHKRRFVPTGTGNQRAWLRDETGGRRFWPVTCGVINVDWLRTHRDQLIAEGLSLYEDGATWWEVPAAAHAQAVERHQQVSMYEETIREHLLGAGLYDGSVSSPAIEPPDPTLGNFTSPQRWGNVVTPLRVAVQWLRIPHDQAERHQYSITQALTRLGWRSTVTSYRRNGVHKALRCWVPVDPVAREGVRSTNGLSIITYSEDITPF